VSKKSAVAGGTEGTQQQGGQDNDVENMEPGGGKDKKKRLNGASTPRKKVQNERNFLEYRWLRKKGRTQCVAEMIRKLELEFTGLQETKSMDFSYRYLESLAGNK
jgi:hypothetical protein